MNLKLTKVLGDITGVTGLKIIRAIVAGERDPQRLAKLRDRRCKHSEAEIAVALDGRYRVEHVTELKLCLTMWDKYQEVIAELDNAIAVQLRAMAKQTTLPLLPPKPRVRGRKPHDPRFDVRKALYFLVGIDLTAIEGIDEIHALTLISEPGEVPGAAGAVTFSSRPRRGRVDSPPHDASHSRRSPPPPSPTAYSP